MAILVPLARKVCGRKARKGEMHDRDAYSTFNWKNTKPMTAFNMSCNTQMDAKNFGGPRALTVSVYTMLASW